MQLISSRNLKHPLKTPDDRLFRLRHEEHKDYSDEDDWSCLAN